MVVTAVANVFELLLELKEDEELFLLVLDEINSLVIVQVTFEVEVIVLDLVFVVVVVVEELSQRYIVGSKPSRSTAVPTLCVYIVVLLPLGELRFGSRILVWHGINQRE